MALALGAQGFCATPVDRKLLLGALGDLAGRQPVEKVLLIDDEEISRYVARQFLAETRLSVIEAADGEEGIRLALQERPQAILLDLVMPGMSGLEVLRRLKSDPETSGIAVIVHTSKTLHEDERSRLRQDTIAVLSKGEPPEQSAAQVRRLLADHVGSLKR
jgi:CheY-like chemotaxis protein